MIELPELEGVILEFQTEFDAERNQLIPIRAKYFTQTDMANWLGRSLRTIQHFEKGKNYDPFILTGYRVMAEFVSNSK